MTREKNHLDNKMFKTICLVSSAAFSAASCVWPWTAPIGAGLGLYANIETKNQPELEAEFTVAVDNALSKTRNNLTTDDSKRIIDELSSDIVRPDNLDDLISKTDTYRSQYCTALDKKRIVEMFDVYFSKEVCKCELLSNYYLLAAGKVTLEKIKGVSDALLKQDKELTVIEKNVNEINSKAAKIIAIFNVLLSECGFVLIAVAGCLSSALAYKIHVPLFYLQVVVCYIISSLFTFSILRAIDSKANAQKTIDYKTSKGMLQTTMSQMLFNLLVRFFAYTAVSIGVYLIIVASQSLEQVEQQYETIMKQVGCIAIGCMISCWLRAWFQPWTNRPK